MATTSEIQARDPSTDAATPRVVIVVGVDGSDGSSAALVWAEKEAQLRDATLRVVHAWHIPSSGYTGAGYLATTSFEEIANDAETALRSQITAVLGAHRAVPVDGQVVEGPAARAILEASKDAEMVVVGSRGRGGFAGLLLGSVSGQVAHHADCPVVIVRS